jgi:hypothetical protein
MNEKFISKDEIEDVLEKHLLYTLGKEDGKKANLSGANLSEIDLPKINLSGADLSEANFFKANLSEANLSEANLSKANLSKAHFYRANLSRTNLFEAHFYRANLSETNFSEAYLDGANFYKANLSKADFYKASLYGTNFFGANLFDSNFYRSIFCETNFYGANLTEAKIKFRCLPSIKMLLSFNLDELSDKLTLELMRRDAWAHPKPELFDLWAQEGDCPYKNEERFWSFSFKRELWKPGPPEMRDSDLIIAICKEKGWEIPEY